MITSTEELEAAFLLPPSTVKHYRLPDGSVGRHSFHVETENEFLPEGAMPISQEEFYQALADQQAEWDAAALANQEAALTAGQAVFNAKRSAAQRLMEPPMKLTAEEAAAIVGLTPEEVA